jgi:Cysteine-rich CWC
MCKHEEKHCPRCNHVFECKPGNITQCQCFGITFNEEEKQLMAGEYTDCLCCHCLIEMKNEFTVQAKQLPLQKNEH